MHDIQDFQRILSAVLNNPLLADQLVESVAKVAATGTEELQRAMETELARAITMASAAPRPFAKPVTDQQRIDILMLSPGGVVLKGGFHGKGHLADLLNCTVDEGRPLAALNSFPFAQPFAAVREGRKSADWFDFAHGQAGFAAAWPNLSEAPLEKPDCIFAFFITDQRATQRQRDPVSNIAPLELAKLFRQIDPSKPKTPKQWAAATPDRRKIKLKDGRTLSMRLYGLPTGRPVIVFGAIHKSTMADAYLANAAIAHGLCLIVLERPGLGASDVARVTSYEAVADDAAEAAAALGLREAAVYGAGSAASFALATAARLGSIVKAVALAAPRIGRPSAEAPSAYGRVWWALLKNPSGLEVTARLLRQLRIAGSAQALLSAFSVSNENDKRILFDEGVLAYATAQTNDAFHLTVDGGLAEFRLYQSGAFFDPAKVAQPIRVWQGEQDRTLLFEDTKRALAGAANVSFNLVPGRGTLMDQAEANDVARWLEHGWKGQAAASPKRRSS